MSPKKKRKMENEITQAKCNQAPSTEVGFV